MCFMCHLISQSFLARNLIIELALDEIGALFCIVFWVEHGLVSAPYDEGKLAHNGGEDKGCDDNFRG